MVGARLGPIGNNKARKIQTQTIRLLRMLPGVGVKTARTLLLHFDNIKNIVNSSEKELLDIPGLGKKTAAQIQKILNSGNGEN